MKKKIFNEIFSKIKEKSILKRKLQIFAVVVITGIFALGGITIWAGISGLSYLSSKATEVIQLPIAQDQLKNLKSEFKTIPKIQALSCWGKVQSLLTAQPWIERPIFDNLINLKLSCLDSKPIVCESHNCTII